MSTELTNEDYTNILLFYKMPIPKSKRLLKKQAENIMSEKLCRCLKKVQMKPIPEGKAIGLCTKSKKPWKERKRLKVQSIQRLYFEVI